MNTLNLNDLMQAQLDEIFNRTLSAFDNSKEEETADEAEILSLVEDFIQEGYNEAADMFQHPTHKKSIAELHEYFNTAKAATWEIKAIEDARRACLLYAMEISINFYRAGFKDGMRFLNILKPDPEPEVTEDKEWCF